MPQLKPGTIIPTPDEDYILHQAALSDADAHPFTDQEWESIKTTASVTQPPFEIQKTSVIIDRDAHVLVESN